MQGQEPMDSQLSVIQKTEILFLLPLNLSPIQCQTPHNSAVKPLKEVQIPHVLGGVYGGRNLVVVEDYPSAIFQDVSNIMSTVGRGSHVAHYPKKPVSCIKPHNKLLNANVQPLKSATKIKC